MRGSRKLFNIFIGVLLLSIITGSVLSDEKVYQDIKPNSESIELMIYDIEVRKGFVIMNDSLIVNGDIYGFEIGARRKYKLRNFKPPLLLI